MSTNLFSVAGKVCVLTGGTGVLGGAIAKHLLANEAVVVILGSNQERLVQRLTELNYPSEKLAGYLCDVLDEQKVTEVANKIMAQFKRVDVLLNAAGGNVKEATISPDQTILDLSTEAFKRVNDLNLIGTLIPSKIFAGHMADQKQGCIINYSSMAALQSITRVVGYSTAKAAVMNLTSWMATEFALKFGDGIRVNAIAPGFFIGNQNRALLLNDDGSLTERGQDIIANTPMRRFGEAEELNGAIHWLISDAASFVTGAHIPVDGGFSVYSGV